MMTDERQGAALLETVERMPMRAGIVFRHYSLPLDERRSLFSDVRRIARRRSLVLLLAGPAPLARSWGANGCHGNFRRTGNHKLWLTASVHNLLELRSAERSGVDAVFVSPLFATRSHPGGRTLGRTRFALLARAARVPVIALGGVGADTRGLAALGVWGWAGIDTWSA